MAERTREIPETKRLALIKKIALALTACPEVSFAYVHGSFAKGGRFRDIDVAIFLGRVPASPLKCELEMEAGLSEVADRLPVDVRILNAAPLSFKYQVIKGGMPLLVRNDDERADFVEGTLAQYFDFSYHRTNYLKETIGLGV